MNLECFLYKLIINKMKIEIREREKDCGDRERYGL